MALLRPPPPWFGQCPKFGSFFFLNPSLSHYFYTFYHPNSSRNVVIMENSGSKRAFSSCFLWIKLCAVYYHIVNIYLCIILYLRREPNWTQEETPMEVQDMCLIIVLNLLNFSCPINVPYLTSFLSKCQSLNQLMMFLLGILC